MRGLAPGLGRQAPDGDPTEGREGTGGGISTLRGEDLLQCGLNPVLWAQSMRNRAIPDGHVVEESPLRTLRSSFRDLPTLRQRPGTQRYPLVDDMLAVGRTTFSHPTYHRTLGFPALF